jgi:hypothetical protein
MGLPPSRNDTQPLGETPLEAAAVTVAVYTTDRVTTVLLATTDVVVGAIVQL